MILAQNVLLIIGAMKGGTTSLFEVLRKHPQIAGSVPKEPHFFCENSRDIHPVCDYMDLWSEEERQTCSYLMEASTGYSKVHFEPNVFRDIKASGISPKFIYVVRDPYDRIESHYNFMKRRSYFNSSITDEHLVQTSNYGLQLRAFLRYFSLEEILIIDFDHLVHRPRFVLNTIFDFLKLPNANIETIEQRNIRGDFDLITSIVMNSPLRRLVKYAPRSAIKCMKWLGSQCFPISEHPVTLSVTQREAVREALIEDMRYFGSITGFDVAKWGF